MLWAQSWNKCIFTTLTSLVVVDDDGGHREVISFELLHEGGEDDILPPRLEFPRCDNVTPWAHGYR